MRWSIIRLIWLRELRDQLRDRRTLFMIAVLPVLLYPVLGYGVLQFALGFREKPSVIGLVVPAGSRTFPFASYTPMPQARACSPSMLNSLPGAFPGLSAASLVHQAVQLPLAYPPLVEDGGFTTMESSGNLEATVLRMNRQNLQVKFLGQMDEDLLKDRTVDLILTAPEFLARLEAGEDQDAFRPCLEVHGKLDEEHARRAWQRLQPLLGHWKKNLKQVRLARHGLTPNFDQPFEIQTPSEFKIAAGPGSIFELLVRVFPFLLVMWSLAGALYPAVDLCAGEKERGTMETLLITPTGREEIVLGKFLTIWVFSAATALLNLLSMGLTTWTIGKHFPQGALPIGAILWCVVLIIPLSALFGALCLAIGAYARSSKEGQYYLMPLFLVIMPLIFLTLAPGVQLNPFYSLVPVTGVALLMQKLMTVTTLDQVPWLYFIPVLAPLALYSFLALRWAIDQFQREEVLFREAERLDFLLWLRRLFREKPATPSPGQALFCFGLILGLRWLTAGLGKDLPLMVHSGVTLLGLVAAPALFMPLLLTTRPRQSLALQWPRWREVGLAGLLAVLLLPPMATLFATIFLQFPHLTKLLEDGQPLIQELRGVFEGTLAGGNPLGSPLILYALLPALCEELAFRGFILSGLLKRFRPRTAIVVSSFMFALFHMNVFQFLPAFFLGIILGLLTVRSGSLGPAMIFHFLHNSILIAATFWGPRLEPSWTETMQGLWPGFVFACLAIALGLLWWLYRMPNAEVEPRLIPGPVLEPALEKK